MENKNIEEEKKQEENINQNESKEEQILNNNQNIIKEFNIKIPTENNIQKDEIQQNISDNNNEEMAVNKMDIDKEPSENNIEEEKKNTESAQNENENKKERTSLIRFPLAKIKNIMKLDNDIKLCQKDAYTVIGKMTEMFLQELARGAYAVCKSCRRKTINLEDINSAIKMDPKMGFINFNSIFYVQELNKVKKRATSTKKVEKKMEKEKIEGEDNINENNANNKEKKKRGKTTKTKNINPIRNKTLDSMFGNKDNK
jgi:DNA polymerase epsilon subunit 4